VIARSAIGELKPLKVIGIDIVDVYYRFAHFVFPFWTLFPNGPLADNVLAQGWVPMDDTHTMAFTFSWTRKTPVLQVDKRGEPLPLLDRVSRTLPNTPD
jgi:hypothetical protein